MRIAQIAPPWISVPPTGYGGTEWVVQQLCDGLVARGHEVTLFASGDSHTTAKLCSIFPAQIPERMGMPSFEAQHSGFALADILSRSGERAFDLVHDHSGFFVVAAAGLLALPPVLHTIHCAFDDVATPFYGQYAQAVAFASVSHHQGSLGPAAMNWAGTVHNAVDLREWPYHPQKDDYLLAFGRVCEAKGFHLAIEVARRTGRHLLMAGALQPQYVDYFQERIVPELDDQVVYLGEVSDERRRELFANAAAFLFPILWPEPFGLVMIEAMASGTPVVALRNGAVPEVVEHGVTGFIADDVGQMVAAVEHIGDIDGARCRRAVEESFSVEQLISGYEEIDGRLVAARTG